MPRAVPGRVIPSGQSRPTFQASYRIQQVVRWLVILKQVGTGGLYMHMEGKTMQSAVNLCKWCDRDSEGKRGEKPL
jgi:hypothetical protein